MSKAIQSIKMNSKTAILTVRCCRWLVVGLLCLAPALWGTTPSSGPDNPLFPGRHIIILTDLSAVLNHPASLPQIRNAVLAFLQNEPSGDKPGACVSFVTTGVNWTQLQRLQQISNNFWGTWTNSVLQWDEDSPVCSSDIAELQAPINSRFARLPQQAVTYGLSYFSFPALFARKPSVYAAQVIVIRISDFALDNPTLRQLDESYLPPPERAILTSAREQFYASFHTETVTVHRSGPWILEVLEVKPANPILLAWKEPAAYASQASSGWRLEMRGLELNPAGQAEIRSVKARLLDGSQVLGSMKSGDSGALALPLQASQPRTALDEAKNPSLQTQAALDYAAPGSFGFHLGIVQEAETVAIHRTFMAPLWQRVLIYGVLPGIVCLLAVYWLFLRSFSLHVHVVEAANGICALEWKNGSRHITIEISKVTRFLFRPCRVYAQITDLPRTPGFNAALRLKLPGNQEISPGVREFVGSPTKNKPITVKLVVDLTNTTEPARVEGTFRVRVHIWTGRKSWPTYVSFIVSPFEGNFWLGIDPGTSGCCIAGGDQIGNIELVPLTKVRSEEDRYVAPSLVYVCPALGEFNNALEFRRNGTTLKYLAGEGAAPFELDHTRIFRSAKRLIGYNTSRPFAMDGATVTLCGSDAVEMLVKSMLSSAEAHFRNRPRNLGPPPRLNKAVLAVPNTFTPGKINQMKDCCRRASAALKVEHIYEAEAVLMFYLSRYDKLNGARADRGKSLRRTARGERVLVFDFGGGSANYTYASICGNDAPIEVTVHQRLGFALGGDHLDAAIARYIWEQVRGDEQVQKRNFRPFDENISKEEKDLRLELLRMAREIKPKISELARAEQWDSIIRLSSSSTPDLRDAFQRCNTISPKLVLESMDVEKLLDELAAGVNELVQLCKRTNSWQGVDTLVFTGRSTRFPNVSDRIRRILNEEAHAVALAEEAKICVAMGAAFWGMSQNTIHLRRAPVAFAHYGVARYASEQVASLEFISLVEAGRQFRNGICRGRYGPRDFPFNGWQVKLYQLMGADTKAALCDQDKAARRSLLKTFQLDNTLVSNLVLELKEDDSYNATLEQETGSERQGGSVEVFDIGEDSDVTARWLVDVD